MTVQCEYCYWNQSFNFPFDKYIKFHSLFPSKCVSQLLFCIFPTSTSLLVRTNKCNTMMPLRRDIPCMITASWPLRILCTAFEGPFSTAFNSFASQYSWMTLCMFYLISTIPMPLLQFQIIEKKSICIITFCFKPSKGLNLELLFRNFAQFT